MLLAQLGYESSRAYCLDTVGLNFKHSRCSFIGSAFLCSFLHVKLLIVLQLSELQLSNNTITFQELQERFCSDFHL